MRPADTAGFGPVGTNGPAAPRVISKVTEDYRRAREAAEANAKMLAMCIPDVAALISSAYQAGYVDGLRAERASHNGSAEGVK